MGQPENLGEVVDVFLGILDLLVPLIFSVTLLYVVWKIVQLWILSPGEVDKVQEGKRVALTGIIALVFMSGIWGILALLRVGIFGY